MALPWPHGTPTLTIPTVRPTPRTTRWARDLGVTGVGIDLSRDFVAEAHSRAVELGVTDRVTFRHGDAAGHVADEAVEVAACLGASWIGGERWHGRVEGTLALLVRSLRPGGTILLGEPFWRLDPPDQRTVDGCHMQVREDCTTLPQLVEHIGTLGYDVVEMVLSDEDSWDRYAAAQWLAMRRWLDSDEAAAEPDLAAELRAALDREPADHVRHQRPYLGWGVFVLMPR